jgi:ribosome-associated protein
MDGYLLRTSIRGASEAAYSRSGGPGGQNVNKVNTRVTLRIPLSCLAGLSEAELARLREQLAGRITKEDELIVNADGERSQRTNQEQAYARLEALIAAAARLPKRRRPTKPSRAAREARIHAKRLHSETKKDRRFSPDEN